MSFKLPLYDLIATHVGRGSPTFWNFLVCSKKKIQKCGKLTQAHDIHTRIHACTHTGRRDACTKNGYLKPAQSCCFILSTAAISVLHFCCCCCSEKGQHDAHFTHLMLRPVKKCFHLLKKKGFAYCIISECVYLSIQVVKKLSPEYRKDRWCYQLLGWLVAVSDYSRATF